MWFYLCQFNQVIIESANRLAELVLVKQSFAICGTGLYTNEFFLPITVFKSSAKLCLTVGTVFLSCVFVFPQAVKNKYASSKLMGISQLPQLKSATIKDLAASLLAN